MPSKVKIACVVYTYHANRQDVRQNLALWGQYCDYYRSYSDEQYTDEFTQFTSIDAKQDLHPPLWDKVTLLTTTNKHDSNVVKANCNANHSEI